MLVTLGNCWRNLGEKRIRNSGFRRDSKKHPCFKLECRERRSVVRVNRWRFLNEEVFPIFGGIS